MNTGSGVSFKGVNEGGPQTAHKTCVFTILLYNKRERKVCYEKLVYKAKRAEEEIKTEEAANPERKTEDEREALSSEEDSF